MKLFSNEIELNAKIKLAFALCTVLVLSPASVRADDKDKDTSQGGPGTASKAQAGQAGQLAPAAEKFVREAASSGMMEVRLGKLGTQKAQSEQVKQFAQRLVDDHTRANTELRQIATSKGITLPDPDRIAGTPGATEPDRTQVREKTDAHSAAHKEFTEAIKKLEGLSGTEFDRTFIKTAITHHEKDVKEFERASQNLDDPGLKSFAAKTLPTLREHLSQAKSLQAQVGGVGAPGADTDTDAGKVKSDDDK